MRCRPYRFLAKSQETLETNLRATPDPRDSYQFAGRPGVTTRFLTIRVDATDGPSPMSWKAIDWVTETDCLAAPLSANSNGIRYPARILARRLAERPEPPTASQPAVPWCGKSNREGVSYIAIQRL